MRSQYRITATKGGAEVQQEITNSHPKGETWQRIGARAQLHGERWLLERRWYAEDLSYVGEWYEVAAHDFDGYR